MCIGGDADVMVYKLPPDPAVVAEVERIVQEVILCKKIIADGSGVWAAGSAYGRDTIWITNLGDAQEIKKRRSQLMIIEIIKN